MSCQPLRKIPKSDSHLVFRQSIRSFVFRKDLFQMIINVAQHAILLEAILPDKFQFIGQLFVMNSCPFCHFDEKVSNSSISSTEVKKGKIALNEIFKIS